MPASRDQNVFLIRLKIPLHSHSLRSSDAFRRSSKLRHEDVQIKLHPFLTSAHDAPTTALYPPHNGPEKPQTYWTRWSKNTNS